MTWLAVSLSALAAVYLAVFLFSPFPYWRTYLVLWRRVLSRREPRLPASARLRQVRFLLRHGLFAPVGTLLWWLDELLFPGYRGQEVRPVFIIGQPRSGTTFLHRTLAADDSTFFAVRHIEWRYPYITFQKVVRFLGLAERLKDRSYWPDSEAGRRAARMHRDTMYDWEEDGIFFEECFLHHFFIFLHFPYPDLLTYLDEYPDLPPKVQQRILETHRKVIRKVMYLRGRNRFYLSKEVTSHNKIPRMLRLYPGARYIVVGRSSTDCLSSLLELVRVSTQAKTAVDPLTIPGWEETVMARTRLDSGRFVELYRHIIDPARQVRVSYRRLIEDVPRSVAYIYDRLGLEPGGAFLAHLQELGRRQEKRDRGYDYERRRFDGFEEFDAVVAEIDREHQAALATPAGVAGAGG